jgi:hypothetical protein
MADAVPRLAAAVRTLLHTNLSLLFRSVGVGWQSLIGYTEFRVLLDPPLPFTAFSAFCWSRVSLSASSILAA